MKWWQKLLVTLLNTLPFPKPRASWKKIGAYWATDRQGRAYTINGRPAVTESNLYMALLVPRKFKVHLIMIRLHWTGWWCCIDGAGSTLPFFPEKRFKRIYFGEERTVEDTLSKTSIAATTATEA